MSAALRFLDPFHRPGESSPVTWQLRLAFLGALRRVHPEVLQSLHDEMLPRFKPYLPITDWPAFEAALRAWAIRWHLTEDWCFAVAHETLRAWHEHPEAYRPVGWRWAIPSHPVHGLTPEQEVAWRRMTKRGGARTALLATATAAGLERTPFFRSPEPFVWLARYQCGESLTQIASADPDRQRTVRRSLHHAAQLIGLTLRPPKRRGDPAPHMN